MRPAPRPLAVLAVACAAGLAGCGNDDAGVEITDAMDAAARIVASAEPPFGWTPEDVGAGETSVARDVEGTRVVFSPAEGEAIVVGWVSPELPDDAVEPICAEMVRYIEEVAAAIEPDAPFEELVTVDSCVGTAVVARSKTGPMLASLAKATADGRSWFIGTSVDATTGGATRLTVNVSSAVTTDPG